MNHNITFEAIGYINSPYLTREHVPSQGENAKESIGEFIIRDKFIEGIQDLKKGRRIEILFYFHKSLGFDLVIVPFRGTHPTGVFLTRSPDRPNGIGVTTVEVIDVIGNKVTFRGADMINGTPILDIKPAMR